MTRWQDWINGLLGVWLVASPYLLDYALDDAASANAVGVGAALLLFNIMSAWRLIDEGQEILNIIIGAWLVLSPFAFGFEAGSAAGANAVFVGLLIIFFAVSQIRDAAGGGNRSVESTKESA